ncbi:MAG: putative GNAT superfamily acetyltransferase [Paraglaciecola sp.]
MHRCANQRFFNIGKQMKNRIIRVATETDFSAILALNDAFVHFTSPMDETRLAQLHELSAYHKVVEIKQDGKLKIVAFLLAFNGNSVYDSVNYQWFNQRLSDFIYIDRIVIASDQHGKGLGKFFYRDLFDFAKTHTLVKIACEFYILPPNEISQKFHQSFGFYQLDTQWLADGKKRVSLQVADI